MTSTKDRKLRANLLALARRLYRTHIRRQIWRMAFAFLCMALVAGSTAALAYLVKPMLDEIFAEQRKEALIWVSSAVILVFIVRGFATYFQTVTINVLTHRVLSSIQNEVFSQLLRLDLAFFHENAAGKLITRCTSDVNLLRMTIARAMVGLGREFLTLIGLVGLMFYMDWLLATISFLAFPTAVVPVSRAGRRIRKVTKSVQIQQGKLTSILNEVFQGVRHVKAYATERHETGRVKDEIRTVHRLIIRGVRIRAAVHPVMEFLGGVAVVAVILYGGSQVIGGTKTTGELFAFLAALIMAYEPLKKLANWNAQLNEGLAAIERIFEVLDMRPSIVDAPDAKPLQLSGGAIRFEQVQFAYTAGKAALNNVDIDIPAGKTVALVGPSGAGKSTVLNLIPRFYDIAAGRIAVDGQDLRGVTLASLRGAIGLVSQEIVLFDDTVRANIAYGRLDATDAEIVAASEAADAHEFVSALSQGYDTPVGPHGVKLSGGQRQRLVIARAMLKNAPILLLDEATSALDTESERHVQTALARLKQGRTTVVIAHRLSTVVAADLIYVLDQGRVVESGSHAALIAKAGHYARLYALQFSAQEADDTAAGSVQPIGARVRA